MVSPTQPSSTGIEAEARGARIASPVYVTLTTGRARPGEDDAIVALHEDWALRRAGDAGLLSSEILVDPNDRHAFVAISHFADQEAAERNPPVCSLPPLDVLRLRQRPAAWLAIFAMLLGALAPTISRAMAPGAGARLLVDVCSVAGAGFVEIDRAEASRSVDTAIGREGEGGQQAHSPDRCPYCCTHAGVAVASPPPPDCSSPRRAASDFLVSPSSRRDRVTRGRHPIPARLPRAREPLAA